MLVNNLRIAFRHLNSGKTFAIINLLGLSIGLTCCIVLSLFVYDQLTHDQSFEGSDSIYRIVEERRSPEGIEVNSHVPYSFLGPMINSYPEIESATAISGPYSNQQVAIVSDRGQKSNFLESQVLLADSNFFKVFSFKMIHGDRYKALRNPNSVVLTESAAKRFFGSTDVLGKSILVSNKNSIVTGVCQDPPIKSHLAFSYLISSTSVKWFSQDQFNLRYAKCYIKLFPEAECDVLEDKFPDLVNTYLAGEIERIHKVSWEAYQDAGNGYKYLLKPLQSIHLDPQIEDGMKAGTNPVILNVLIVVAVLILTIACINFSNLSMAQSLTRAKEVGVRKVMGSSKHQLIVQFLIESSIISFSAGLVAAMLSFVLIPLFNSFFDVHIIFPLSWNMALYLISISLFLGVLVGFYPALMLSGVKTIDTLKGRQAFGVSRSKLKYLLIGFQFWISLMLLTCTFIFQKQVQFLVEKDLGFDKDQILVIKGTFHKDANFTRPFLEEAKWVPGVKGVAGTLWAMGFNGTWSDKYTVEHASEVHQMRRVPIGDGLAEVLDLELVDGAFFSTQTSDAQSVLLNQAAVKAFGFNDPVGKTIYMLTHDDGLLEKYPFKIKGVLRDFNYQSLHSEVEPLVIQSNETVGGRMSYIFIKLDGHNLAKSIVNLEEKWKMTVPDRAFNYSFMDVTMESKYKSERNLTDMFSFFAALSLFIGAIGLLGLAAYTCRLRIKEISIRKIIGANRKSIFFLLSKDYLTTLMIAFLLAAPLAWYAMDHWLTNFAYRVLITPNEFVYAGVISILLTLIILFSQTIKVAASNPIDSLKAY